MATRTAGSLRPIRADNVRRAFGDTVVLDGAALTVASGEVVALLGGSGSGKSTLLRILAGLDSDATGDITVSTSHAVVFQESRLLPWKRVADNVGLGVTGPQVRERCAAALAEVALSTGAGPGRPNSPAGRRSGSRSPAPSSAHRTCCCSTNRSAPSTR